MNELLAISTGLSRRSTSWKKEEWSWEDLMTKLEKPVITSETYKQYLASTKDVQDQVKDVGGFVGGIVTGGRRKKGAVGERSLITLDIDYANVDFWNDFTIQYGCAAVLHGTHKNGPEMIRLRLIVPLKRSLMADEYEAVSRKLAGNLGIELFDHTTFQPERLMYWPSVSADIDYYFESQDGEWLDPDELLAEYFDWKDMSEWPRHPKEKEVVDSSIKQQADPLLKSGVIGAFCRTFDIHQTIERFLSEDYTSAKEENRYSYIHGSTSSGAVVYDDKFLYSHHSTDPAGEKLCNAYDLLRLHKFGDGEKSTSEVNTYILEIEEVKGTLGTERLEMAKYAFAEDIECVVVTDTEWIKKLDYNKKGREIGEIKNTIGNVEAIFKNDPNLSGKLGYDEFANREVTLGSSLPWRKTKPFEMVTDRDDAGLRGYLESVYGITSPQKIQDGSTNFVRSKSFHPVRDYLLGCYDSWDGEKRVDRLFIDYLGAENNEYVRSVTRKSFVACAARVFNPGCKFETMLTLVGPQGRGKSWILGKLGGKWFSDSMGSLHSKESLENLHGVWIMEMGELSRLKNADVDVIKAFLSKQIDHYRVAYGKRAEDFHRQVVFFGTTNNPQFLTDVTGNRRFWPVTINGVGRKSVFTDLTKDEVDQFWGEVVDLYKKGESLFLADEVAEHALEIQKEHTEYDEREGLILNFIKKQVPVDWKDWNLERRRSYYSVREGLEEEIKETVDRVRISAVEVWCEFLGEPISKMSGFNVRYVNNILKGLTGWKPAKFRIELYGQVRGFERILGQWDK